MLAILIVFTWTGGESLLRAYDLVLRAAAVPQPEAWADADTELLARVIAEP